MRQPSPRARGWLRKVFHNEAQLSDVPPEYYQTVKALLREARMAEARLNRILEGR
jgi:hypothetical protein